MKEWNNSLDKDLPIPLYHQLKGILLEKIRSGEMKPNDRLPAEDELASRYGISKATVRQALNELATEGVLRREQGRGTFVSAPNMAQGPHLLTSFHEEMKGRGLRPSSQVLEQEIVKADALISDKLQIAEGDSVVKLKRLRLADGEPMGIQTAYIPLDSAPGLADEDFASLYEVLEKKYGLVPVRAQETYFAVLPSQSDAELLNVSPTAPGLAAERITYLASNRPLELVFSIMRGDRYKVVLDLTKTI